MFFNMDILVCLLPKWKLEHAAGRRLCGWWISTNIWPPDLRRRSPGSLEKVCAYVQRLPFKKSGNQCLTISGWWRVELAQEAMIHSCKRCL